VIGSSIDAQSLAKIKCIPKLSEISLQGYQPQLHDCLKIITASNRLKSVNLGHWTTVPSDMQMFVDCPNLESLSIGTIACTHQELEPLAKLPHLRQLKVTGPLYRRDLVDDLKCLKSLKELYLARIDNWPESKVRQLAESLKGVQVTNGTHLKVEGVEPFLP
jgi:hypothetical protein